MCGFELVMDFLEKWFHFDKMLPEKFYEWLKVFQGYVRKNDLKMNETLESKYFVLGYYHFGYVMSDSNFQLYKQLSNLNIEYILDKGKSKMLVLHRAVPVPSQKISRACRECLRSRNGVQGQEVQVHRGEEQRPGVHIGPGDYSLGNCMQEGGV